METTATESRIRKEVTKGGLSVSRVYESQWQKEGTSTAELRQEVVTKSYYPTKSIANDKQDNIYGMDEFGFEEQEYVNRENRVAWIDVPEGTSVEEVSGKLAQFPNAGLYRVLSNSPILTENQKYAIESGITHLDNFANTQVVRFPEGSENAGELALDSNGKPQYRAIFFKKDNPVDEDLRTADEEFYASPEIKAEMASGQTAETHVVADQKL